MFIILSLLIGIIIGVIVFYLIIRLTSHLPSPISQSGESPSFSDTEARAILIGAGFEVLEKGKRFPLIVYVDDKSHLSNIPVDYYVIKEKKTYAVKVKTGLAIEATDPTTMRKLIEYDYATNADGLLLLDMANGELHEIRFKVPRSERDNFLIIFFTVFIILFIIGIIYLFFKVRLI